MLVGVAAWRARLVAPAGHAPPARSPRRVPRRGQRAEPATSSATGRSAELPPRVVAATRGARGPALLEPSRRRPARGGPRCIAEPARTGGGSPAPRRWRCRWRGCRTPGAQVLRPQGGRGDDRRCSSPLRYGRARRPRALPAPRPLRQPHPRHRLRRAALPRQAGRGPQLGRDRLPCGAPAGADADEPVRAGGAEARRRARAGASSGSCGRRRGRRRRSTSSLAAQIRPLRIPRSRDPADVALHEILRFERELRERVGRRLPDPPIVATTLDLVLQARVADMSRDAVADWDDRGAGNAAVMVLDRRTREVLACVGSAGFFDGPRRGAIDFTRVPRSPGSTLKPFLYALALDLGTITPATVLDDLAAWPGRHRQRRRRVPRPAPAARRPRQLEQRAGRGPPGARRARGGLRVPARARHPRWPAAGARYGLGLAIGGMPVTLERLVRAYTALAGDGRVASSCGTRHGQRTGGAACCRRPRRGR